MPDWGSFVTLVVTLLGAAVAAISAFAARKKTTAEADSTIASTAIALVKNMREELESVKADYKQLRVELETVKTENEEYRKVIRDLKRQLEIRDARIKMLCMQIVSKGDTPVWQPEEEGG